MNDIFVLPLKNSNKICLIDSSDSVKVLSHKWRLTNKGLIWSMINDKLVSLHRYVMDVTDSKIQVDHKNRNRLDNRKHELRVCNNQQNCCNQSKRSSTNKFKGVGFHKETNKYRASITVGYKFIHLGLFTDEVEAAKAYNTAAIKYQGQYAVLNTV